MLCSARNKVQEALISLSPRLRCKRNLVWIILYHSRESMWITCGNAVDKGSQNVYTPAVKSCGVVRAIRWYHYAYVIPPRWNDKDSERIQNLGKSAKSCRSWIHSAPLLQCAEAWRRRLVSTPTVSRRSLWRRRKLKQSLNESDEICMKRPCAPKGAQGRMVTTPAAMSNNGRKNARL